MDLERNLLVVAAFAYRPHTAIDQVPILPFRQDKLRVDQCLAHTVLGIAAAYRRPLIAAEQSSETVTARWLLTCGRLLATKFSSGSYGVRLRSAFQ
jgi:hypothetical protein